jgi:hypothetical protein
MCASASLGPEVDNSLVQADPSIWMVTLGRHLSGHYDANKNRFQVFLNSEPLQFAQLNDALLNSNDLAGKMLFLQGGIESDLRSTVTSIALGRSDGRWLPPEKLRTTERSGSTWYYGRLAGRWR